MAVIKITKLLKNSEIVIQNKYQILYKYKEESNIKTQRVYYYIGIKFGQKISHISRIKSNDLEYYKKKIQFELIHEK